MSTTIQISIALKEELSGRKLYERETYEEVILDLIEDTRELSNQTKAEITRARNEIREGRVRTLSEVREELGI